MIYLSFYFHTCIIQAANYPAFQRHFSVFTCLEVRLSGGIYFRNLKQKKANYVTASLSHPSSTHGGTYMVSRATETQRENWFSHKFSIPNAGTLQSERKLKMIGLPVAMLMHIAIIHRISFKFSISHCSLLVVGVG